MRRGRRGCALICGAVRGRVLRGGRAASGLRRRPSCGDGSPCRSHLSSTPRPSRTARRCRRRLAGGSPRPPASLARPTSGRRMTIRSSTSLGSSRMGGLSCEETTGGGRAVYAGHLQFTTPNPRKAEGCTIWANNFEEAQELYVKRGCAALGARPPVPFAIGALQVASRQLAGWVASSVQVRRAAAATIEEADCAGGGSTQDKPACRLEDAYTGQWMSRAPLAVSYVRMSWRLVHDLRCHVKHSRLHPSNVPTNASVAIHKLKRRGALEYLWRLYGNGSWHNARAHQSAACWELAFGKERLARPSASTRSRFFSLLISYNNNGSNPAHTVLCTAVLCSAPYVFVPRLRPTPKLDFLGFSPFGGAGFGFAAAPLNRRFAALNRDFASPPPTSSPPSSPSGGAGGGLSRARARLLRTTVFSLDAGPSRWGRRRLRRSCPPLRPQLAASHILEFGELVEKSLRLRRPLPPPQSGGGRQAWRREWRRCRCPPPPPCRTLPPPWQRSPCPDGRRRAAAALMSASEACIGARLKIEAERLSSLYVQRWRMGRMSCAAHCAANCAPNELRGARRFFDSYAALSAAIFESSSFSFLLSSSTRALAIFIIGLPASRRRRRRRPRCWPQRRRRRSAPPAASLRGARRGRRRRCRHRLVHRGDRRLQRAASRFAPAAAVALGQGGARRVPALLPAAVRGARRRARRRAAGARRRVAPTSSRLTRRATSRRAGRRPRGATRRSRPACRRRAAAGVGHDLPVESFRESDGRDARQEGGGGLDIARAPRSAPRQRNSRNRNKFELAARRHLYAFTSRRTCKRSRRCRRSRRTSR